METLIPELYDNISIESLESSDELYIIYSKALNQHIKINSITKRLIQVIDGKRNIEEIIECLKTNEGSNKNINYKSILSTIYDLQKIGIIKSDDPLNKKPSSIWFNFTLIPENIVNQISKIFVPLFFNGFYYFITISIIFLVIIYLSFINKLDFYNFFSIKNILLYLPIAYLSRFLHEFGHASAIKNFKLRAGAIGFGFYLFTPVFYADVSHAWKLCSSKRIVINIAGMYFQLILSLILSIIFLITQIKWYLIVSLFNLLSTFPNLNPFIKFDGYWLLSDALDIPNLQKKSIEKLSQFIFWFKKKKSTIYPFKSKIDYFLFFYSIFNRLMIIIFITITLIISKSSILLLPQNLMNTISDILNCINCNYFKEIKDFIFNNFFPILFYFLFIGFIFSKAKTIFSDFIKKTKHYKRVNNNPSA